MGRIRWTDILEACIFLQAKLSTEEHTAGGNIVSQIEEECLVDLYAIYFR